MKIRLFIACLFATICLFGNTAGAGDDFDDAKRVVFLGDSITYSGQYVADIEAIWRLKYPDRKIEFVNIGLPSETVSGLSEDGHAGGRFPRPDLHERLGRVLEKLKPDVVVACYGMNCGIYQPYSDQRFDAFRNGMAKLREACKNVGAKLIHLTPPAFDPHPILANTVAANEFLKPNGRGMYVGYNEVLDLYSAWLLAQRGNGWIVYDAHGPMNTFLAAARKKDPAFRLANDGVHLNDLGHWLIARRVLHHLGFEDDVCEMATASDAVQHLHKIEADKTKQYIDLIRKSQRVATNSWLTETGHLRPGIKDGVSVKDATLQIGILDKQIHTLLDGK